MPYQERHIDANGVDRVDNGALQANNRRLLGILAALIVTAIVISGGLLVISGPGQVAGSVPPYENRRMPTTPAP